MAFRSAATALLPPALKSSYASFVSSGGLQVDATVGSLNMQLSLVWDGWKSEEGSWI
jgi:hypothetical protein